VRPSSGDWAVVILAFVVIGGVLALVLMSAALMAYTILRPFL